MISENILWTAVVTICIAYVAKLIIWRLTHRFPPGPWGLPLLGYKPFLSNSPSKDYLKLQEKYGPIIGLRLGTRYTVVLNDFADIKDAFNRNEFLDRPHGWFQVSEQYGHLVDMNGWEWKETRRLTVMTLRNLGVGKNKIEEKIQEEVTQLLSKVEKAGPAAEINLMDMIYLPLLNIILTITCGRPFDDGERLLKALLKYNKEVLYLLFDNHRKIYYSFLKPLFWFKKTFFTRDIPSCVEMMEFVRKETEDHERNYDENNLEDFMSYYIKDMKASASKKTSLTSANLLGNCQGLLFAGTDTTRITMAWILLHLAEHQEGQQRMYQEIVRLIGKERTPSWSDRENLPYTEAFILESARFNTLAPADDPHWSTCDTRIGGYFIPKDSIVLANVLAVHMDKKLWGDPENFRPERFLSADGKKAITPEYWIPFLTGKRACPGSKLANMQLFLFVSALVQRFHVVAPKSGLSLEVQCFFMNFPEKPVVSFEMRN